MHLSSVTCRNLSLLFCLPGPDFSYHHHFTWQISQLYSHQQLLSSPTWYSLSSQIMYWNWTSSKAGTCQLLLHWGSPWHSRSLVFVEKNPWRAELVGHGLKGLFAFVSMSSQALALLTFRKEKGFAFSKDSNPNPMFPAWMQVQYIQLTKTEWALCKTTKKKEYREHFFLKKPKEMKWVPTALQIGFNLYEN